MAPAIVAFGGGPVNDVLSPPFVNGFFARRQQSSASSSGSSSPLTVVRISAKMNERGDFNGSCTREEAITITPETPDGSCTSYFRDVTDYCCAAVGGVFNDTYQAVNVSQEQALALNHPICGTSNYADMFSCYQYVTESHCSATTPVPYGVCNRNGLDTSKLAQSSSSAPIGSKLPSQFRWLVWTYAAMLSTSAIYALVSFSGLTLRSSS